MKVFFCLLVRRLPKIYICFYISCRRAVFCALQCPGKGGAEAVAAAGCCRYDMQVLHFLCLLLIIVRYF